MIRVALWIVAILFVVIIWPVLSIIYVREISVIYHATPLRGSLLSLYGIIFGFTMITITFVGDKKYFTELTGKSFVGSYSFPELLVMVSSLTLYLIALNILDYFTPSGLLEHIVLLFQITPLFAIFLMIYTLLLVLRSYFQKENQPKDNSDLLKSGPFE